MKMNPSEFPDYMEEVSETGDVRAGSPLPLGAHRRGEGANFAIFSRHATGVQLAFFDAPGDAEPARVIEFDPVYNRTGDVWHVWVGGVPSGQLYGYRIAGPYQPEKGHRFNPHKLLLDPLAEAVTYREDWNFGPALGYDPNDPDEDLSYSEVDDAGAMPKSVFAPDYFDWEGDEPLKRPLAEAVIYETHVRGFTVDDSSGVEHPGSYRGLTEKIPYLRELGVTAVELMPVQEFNENELDRVNPETGEPLKNYWGYNPVAFLAPESRYCCRGTTGHQTLAFREMVKALHDAGIEVIVDIVLNHTAEGSRLGPTFCLRGVDNAVYYLLDGDGRDYTDYTGTGNTVKADHPVVRDFILNTLRHWVVEMHVDGFRFDLASVLGRDEEGEILADAPLLERIAEDPILREAELIAEAWDTGGAYQVGNFAERRWAEWNGQYRDDVRRFWRGDEGMVGDFASRIAGSADLYQGSGKGPERSINYVTAHDGFTMNDLVSYDRKHNEANGEDNRDGTDHNYSDNYGVEGETDDPEIQAVRRRQIKNFFLTLFVSRGVPMVLGGDEFRRTQQGNNNAYCQDNEISWYDWSKREEHQEIHRFVRTMIAFRKAHPVLRKPAFYTDDEIRWFNSEGESPDWEDDEVKHLGCVIAGGEEGDLVLIFNADIKGVVWTLPEPPGGGGWCIAADTSAAAPDDLVDPGEERALEDPTTFEMGPRSSAILINQGR
jgi:glycogen operon protein